MNENVINAMIMLNRNTFLCVELVANGNNLKAVRVDDWNTKHQSKDMIMFFVKLS